VVGRTAHRRHLGSEHTALVDQLDDLLSVDGEGQGVAEVFVVVQLVLDRVLGAEVEHDVAEGVRHPVRIGKPVVPLRFVVAQDRQVGSPQGTRDI